MESERVTIVIIPGGPGLSPAYLRPWARAAAKDLRASIAEVDYRLFSRNIPAPAARRLESALGAAAKRLRKLSLRGRVVLVGHSFGARIALELLKRSPNGAAAAVLLNCPAEFTPSRSYLRRKKKLSLPSAVDDERSFARYWRAVLPLYFQRAPKPAWIANLARGTSWSRTSWLDSVIRGAPRKASRGSPPLLFINGSHDARFPPSNAARLRDLFPAAAHASIKGSGHFPMLENPRALTAEIFGFLAQKQIDLRRAS